MLGAGNKEEASIAAAVTLEWTKQVVLSPRGYDKDKIHMYSLKSHVQCS
jgi:hypothetical protein